MLNSLAASAQQSLIVFPASLLYEDSLCRKYNLWTSEQSQME